MALTISFLKGINVGGNKKIKMAELKSLYEKLGFTQVQTLLQSGNVVFQGPDKPPAEIASQIEAAIVDHFGFESKILLRSHEQLQLVIAQHPFTKVQISEPSKILVAFLQDSIDDEALTALQQNIPGPEIIFKGTQALYLFYPEGMGRSKLDGGLIERRLKTIITTRNWNTVNKLLALCDNSA